MIRFLLKGLLRDRSRSQFPLLTVAAGVGLTVLLYAWLQGVEGSLLKSTAHFNTGYVRVTTQAYAAEADQVPNDLALLGVDTLLTELRRSYPGLFWTPRILFGGLLDLPDAKGETRAQAPVAGLGVTLLSGDTTEQGLLNLRSSLVRGRLPAAPGEILISDDLASKVGIAPGQVATLISSSGSGSMAMANFTVAGTIRFGVGAMDHGAMIADLADVRAALDLANGAAEILGFFHDDLYHEREADSVTADFNRRHQAGDEFRPVMATLRTASGLSDYLDVVSSVLNLLVLFFVLAMAIVLWNAGLMGSLRRYGEIGVRLAIGEAKGHVYRTMLWEALAVGLVGSALGTAVGLALAYALQVHGLDIGAFLKNSSVMVDNVVRARVTPESAVIGFLPGLLATLLGTGIAGLGIYRRQTSQLFKELEA